MSANPQLGIGKFYSQDELERIFKTKFGTYIKGINPRNGPAGDEGYIIVKAREDGPYDDDIQGDRFTYVGEGLEGDQKRTPANDALIKQAKHSTVPVYFFFQPSDHDELRYEGLVDVVDFEYVFDGERMVYRFTMVQLEADQADELRDAKRTVEHDADDPSLTEDEEEFTEVQRRARSSMFAKRVRNIYDFTCAVCGASRESPDGSPEVEAAHIYPRRDNGKNSIRNGIALCRFHHWAFDNGWIAITDSYHIVVADESHVEGYDDVVHLQDHQLAHLPTNEEFRPHAKYLAAHRELHGF